MDPHNPTETSFGASREREEALGREANDVRVARLGKTIAKVAAVLAAAVLAALVVAEPDVAINWVATYLIPVGVVLAVVIAVLALLVWVIERLLTPPYRDRWQ